MYAVDALTRCDAHKGDYVDPELKGNLDARRAELKSAASASSSASTSSVAAPAASSSLSSSSSSSLSAPAAAAPVAAAAPADSEETESEDEDDGEEKFRSPFKFKMLLRLIQESEIASGIFISHAARENITRHMAAAAIDYMGSGRVFMEAGKGVKTLTEEHLVHGDNAFFRLLPEYKQDGKTVVSIETGKAIADRFVIYENDHGRNSIDIKQHDLDNASVLTEAMIAGLDKRVAERRQTVRRVKAARKEKQAAASKKRKERKADKKEGQPALKKSKPASKSA